MGVLARAQKRTGMGIVYESAMSNHIHLLVQPQSTKQMSDFMRYVNSNIARKIGRLYGWQERFWSKRYSAIIVTDEEVAQVGRLRYLLSQGVKEGLVAHPEDWPGLNTASYLLRGYTEVGGGIWHDRTAESHAHRGSKDPSQLRSTDFVERHLSFKLCPLPCWAHLEKSVVTRAVGMLVDDIVETAKLERGDLPVLGAARVLSQDPWHQPGKVKRSYAPPCHAASRRSRRDLLLELREFADAYLKASADLREGSVAHFPVGCFPPGLPYVSEVGLPDG